jgi:predicted nucleic acid-binding protein
VSLLLDTNVLSELRKGERANALLLDWFNDVADEEIHLSVLAIGEIRRGVESVRKRDGAQAAALERWLTRLIATHAERIVLVDSRVADQWGRLAAIRTGSVIDTLMAATALVHGLVLVTRNVKDVAWTGVSYLDPFVPAH